MKRNLIIKTCLLCSFLLVLNLRVHAVEPNVKDLDDAIHSGDFTQYLNNTSAWLNQQAPAMPTQAALTTLLKKPTFALTLAERQLIAKIGAEKLGAFAKADKNHAVFLSWLLKNTKAMDLYLEGSVPISLVARVEDTYVLSLQALEIWEDIFAADPESKDGIYLKLAIATAILPPGSINIGAGGAKTPAAPLARYQHYKSAYRNKELFPSFDHLTVWEYTKILSSGASNEDLKWAREMINTWLPELKAKELVVNSTSDIWRRNSPIEFDGSFKNVLAGGGKCGPRSSWSVMICHAFGIPAIGVGQPGHACVAYKTAFPMNEPQPGSAWKVGYGRGWGASKLEGISGLDFVAGVQERAHTKEFSEVEHLRWFASALTKPEIAASVMKVAHEIQKSLAHLKTDVTDSLKSDDAEHGVSPQTSLTHHAKKAAVGPVKLAAGVTLINAATFSSMSGVKVVDCYTGGQQVFFEKNNDKSWVEYSFQVTTPGTYSLSLKVAAANVDQVFHVKSGTSEPVTVNIPWSKGLWDITPKIDIELNTGPQCLRISAPLQRGIAVHHLELKSK